MLEGLQNRIVVTGHYGSGKTNLSINLALDLARSGRKVVLADLDIVNPYFRSADFRGLAEANGVKLITPNFANSNLDIPSLTGELDGWLGSESTVIIDVGGDDAGAYALGRYSSRIKEQAYDMLYVINRYRFLTQKPAEAEELLREIETAGRLQATGVVNNSNLARLTTAGDVAASQEYAQQVSVLTDKPLLFTAVPGGLWEECNNKMPSACLYRIQIHVTLPWNS